MQTWLSTGEGRKKGKKIWGVGVGLLEKSQREKMKIKYKKRKGKEKPSLAVLSSYTGVDVCVLTVLPHLCNGRRQAVET